MKEAGIKEFRDHATKYLTVAVALALGAAIWTQDCDFIGCGCPTWATETILAELPE